MIGGSSLMNCVDFYCALMVLDIVVSILIVKVT